MIIFYACFGIEGLKMKLYKKKYLKLGITHLDTMTHDSP